MKLDTPRNRASPKSCHSSPRPTVRHSIENRKKGGKILSRFSAVGGCYTQRAHFRAGVTGAKLHWLNLSAVVITEEKFPSLLPGRKFDRLNFQPICFHNFAESKTKVNYSFNKYTIQSRALILRSETTAQRGHRNVDPFTLAAVDGCRREQAAIGRGLW